MDRRELLKRFGIGAIIAPVIGGIIEPSASAQLIEVPKIKPVELFSKIPAKLDLNKVLSSKLVMSMEDGTTRTVGVQHYWAYGEIAVTDSFTVDVSFSINASPVSTIGGIRGGGSLA